MMASVDNNNNNDDGDGGDDDDDNNNNNDDDNNNNDEEGRTCSDRASRMPVAPPALCRRPGRAVGAPAFKSRWNESVNAWGL